MWYENGERLELNDNEKDVYDRYVNNLVATYHYPIITRTQTYYLKPNTTNKEQTNSSKTDRMVEGGVWIILGIILTIVFTGSSSSGYYVFYGAIIYGLYVLFLKK